MKKANTDAIDKRIKALKQYEILDTLPEKEYDDITRLAAIICNSPIALISLLDDKHQFFKSRYGLKIKKTPIEHSFCAYAIKKPNDVFIVEDARKDKRFKLNPLVTSKPNIVFYTGVPLVSEEGVPLGTLCVIDKKPKSLNSEQILSLQSLANQVMQLLVLRRKNNEIEESKKIINQEAEQLNNIIEATRVGTWEWNYETKTVNINERWANIIGYTVEELQPVNEKTIYKFIHPDDIALSDKKLKECLEKKTPFYEVDFRLKHKDGNYIWVNDKGRVVKWSKEGKPLIMAGTHTDITERKEAEKQLKLSEQLFKELIQEGADLIGVLTIDADYLYVSPTSTTVLGITPEEFIGKNAFDFIHPDDKEIVLNSFSKIAELNKVEIAPFRFINKKGEWRWVETIATNMLDNPAINGIVTNSRDVTERVVSNEKIKENNQRFKLLMQAGTESIWDFNPITNELFLGDGFNRNFGIQIKSLKENNEIINTHIHPDDFSNFRKSFKNALSNKSKDTLWTMKYRIRKANGEYAFVSDRALFMRNDKGEVYRVVGAIKDITQEHFYEQLEVIDREVMTLSMQENANLEQVVSTYLLKLEYLFPNMKASVMKVAEERLYNLASPSLQKEYLKTLNGIKIGKNVGSYGTAAYTKEKVIVENVHKDNRWKKLSHFPKKYKFTACWSYPIFDAKGSVIAIISSYYKTPKIPNQQEEYAIDRAQRLLSILISKFNYLENIKQSNERFELINKATNDAIYDWDIEKDEYYWGDGFYNTFGYEKIDDKFRSSDWDKLTYSLDLEKHKQSWDAFLKDERRQKWMNEFRFRKADGTYLYVEEIGYLLRDKNGEPIRMIGALRDVSRAKLSENQKQLQHQVASIFKDERELPLILEKVLHYIAEYGEYQTAEIWLLSSDKKHLNLMAINTVDEKNQAYIKQTKKIKQFKKGEGLPGKVWKDLQVEIWDNINTASKFIRNNSAKKSGLKSGVGFPLFHNDNFVGVMLLTAIDSLKNDPYRTETFNPLSNFLGAEIKRKQQEEELKLFFNSSPDILAIASPDGHFVKANPAFTKILGYTEEEIISQPFENFLHPDDLKRTIKEYGETITGDRQSQGFTNRYRTKSGSYKWISWNSSDVFGEDGFVFAYGRDVTEMKELQQLLENTSRLAKVGSWKIDVNNNSVYWSDITKEIREADPDFQPTLDSGIKGFVEGDRDIIKKRVEQCKKEGTSWDEELRIITEKGNLKWIRTIGKADFVDGECVKIYGSFQDIHGQKLNEIALKKSLKTLEDYKFSLDQAAIIAITDKTGVITSVNDNFCKISQYLKEELIGKTHQLINSSYHPKSFFVHLWKTIASGKVWSGEIKNLAKDGSFYWVDTTIVPFLDKNNKPFQYLAIRIDITNRKIAEEKIQQSNERFEKVTEATNDAIWDWDIINNQLYWGKGYNTLFGYDVANNTPNLESWSSRIHPDDVAVILKSLDDIIKDPNSANWQHEYKYKKESGEYAYVIDRGVVIRDEKGKATRMVGAMTDISYQKEHEESLKKLNNQLFKYTNELVRSNEELEQFAYVASHDLQEPLRMVTSFLSQLEKKYSDQLDEKAHTYIDFAVDGATRMRQIILDLLKFSRIGKINEKIEKIDIAEVVEQSKVLLRKSIEDKNATIIYKKLPSIFAYRSPIVQIFQNLISNGLKYAKADVAPIIEISAKELKDEWQFAIKDNGIGIDKEYFDKIFIIFQRLHNKSEYSGTGMGLAIVKKIIENFGGKIWLKSIEGKGTTFYFTIKKEI